MELDGIWTGIYVQDEETVLIQVERQVAIRVYGIRFGIDPVSEQVDCDCCGPVIKQVEEGSLGVVLEKMISPLCRLTVDEFFAERRKSGFVILREEIRKEEFWRQ